MKHRKYYIAILLLCVTLFVTAQPRPTLKTPVSLKVGDMCPDLPFNGLRNYPTGSAKLSDFKGKLVILDFWATWCTPCLRTLPKLDAFQKKYAANLQVITVTYQDKATIERFFQKIDIPELKQMSIPIVVNDRLLNNYFVHKYIPHEIWIDGTGKIVAITSGDEVTAENIEAFIKGSSLQLKEKKDVIFNYKKPLLKGALDTSKIDIQFSSNIIGYVDGLSGSMGGRNEPTYKKVYGSNVGIQSMFKYAFGKSNFYFLNMNRSLLEVRDSSAMFYVWPGKKENLVDRARLVKKSVFGYELIVPRETPDDEMFGIMQQDLNRFYGAKFGIRAHIEKRRVKCLVIVKGPATDSLRTNGGQAIFNTDAFGLKMRNTPFEDFVKQLVVLNLQEITTPIINDTGISYNVDMDCNAKMSDVEQLRKALARYGLNFVVADREIDMIIISDKLPPKV